MDINTLVSSLGQLGGVGIVAAILLWQNSKMQEKLFNVIESNTKVITELKEVIENSVERRKV